MFRIRGGAQSVGAKAAPAPPILHPASCEARLTDVLAQIHG